MAEADSTPTAANDRGQLSIAVVDRAVDPRLVLFHAPASREAEQFRGLRSAVLAMNPDQASRTVVLAASTPGEGSTVSTANLALALAELAGTRVLLVDANLRAPGVESLLALPPRPGLAELLADRIPLDRAIRTTVTRGVDVLTAGTPPDNPAELLAKGRLKPLLDTLKPDYSYILLDAPAAVDYTDASIIARDCDGLILVVRLEVVSKTVVEQTVQNLRSLGANLLGAFLVGVPSGSAIAPIDDDRGRRA